MCIRNALKAPCTHRFPYCRLLMLFPSTEAQPEQTMIIVYVRLLGPEAMQDPIVSGSFPAHKSSPQNACDITEPS